MPKPTLLLVLGVLLACGRAPQERVEEPKMDIKTAVDRHAAELMAIPGVAGVFIGELDDKTPCILVLVIEESETLNRAIPDSLEGHPVKVEVSGEFKPMGGQSSPR